MLPFRDVTLNDRELIERFARLYPTRFLNYSFEVLFLWHSACDFMICELDNLLLIKTFYYCNHNYFYPMGEGDVQGAVEQMIEYSERHKCPFNMLKITKEQVDLLEKRFPNRFEYEELRDEMEYIYSTDRLITLSGKHLQPKRNHINVFLKENTWDLEEISQTNLSEIVYFNNQWESSFPPETVPQSMQIENKAVGDTLAHYFDLSLDGLVLRVNGKVEGFSIGCGTPSDTYLTLFERANGTIRGAYPFINREFSKRFAQKYVYVNRAEDCGDEGLRKSKLSYQPIFLDTVYLVSLRR